jgi:hypothetical protein
MPVPRHAPWISPDASDNELSRDFGPHGLVALTRCGVPCPVPSMPRSKQQELGRPEGSLAPLILRFNTLADFSDDWVLGPTITTNRVLRDP